MTRSAVQLHPPRLLGPSRLARWLWLAMLCCISATVHADKPKVRTRVMSIEREATALNVTFDASEFASQEVLNKLQTGLPQTLVVRVAAYNESGKRPWAVSAQSCRVVYDLWEGSYRVRLERPQGTHEFSVRDARKVLDSCLRLRHLPLSKDPAQQRVGSVAFCSVVVELNPMSPATVRRIRRWLSRSSSGQLKGDAFFGSFVSLFVNEQIEAAERTLTFRSQSWVVPP